MAIAISFAALVVSLSTFLASRWRDRRDLLLRVHEHLVTPDQQRVRRLIHVMSSRRMQVEDLSDDEYVLINNALAALNVMGSYCQRRYIRRRDVLQFWAEPVLRLMPAADAFLAHRASFGSHRTWPELRAFAADAQQYVQRRGIDVRLDEAASGVDGHRNLPAGGHEELPGGGHLGH